MSRQISCRFKDVNASGTFAQAQAVARMLAVPVPGESAAAARRRAAGACGQPLRVFERLFYGQEGVSLAAAEALIANEKALVRAKLAQREAELRAVEREIEGLSRRWAELQEDACGEGAAHACALGVGGGSSSGCSVGEARGPRCSAPCSRGPVVGCTKGRATSRTDRPMFFWGSGW